MGSFHILVWFIIHFSFLEVKIPKIRHCLNVTFDSSKSVKVKRLRGIFLTSMSELITGSNIIHCGNVTAINSSFKTLKRFFIRLFTVIKRSKNIQCFSIRFILVCEHFKREFRICIKNAFDTFHIHLGHLYLSFFTSELDCLFVILDCFLNIWLSVSVGIVSFFIHFS